MTKLYHKPFYLRTYYDSGCARPKSDWVRVHYAVANGNHDFIDDDGTCWTEWLTHYQDDIFTEDELGLYQCGVLLSLQTTVDGTVYDGLAYELRDGGWHCSVIGINDCVTFTINACEHPFETLQAEFEEVVNAYVQLQRDLS